MIEDRELRDMFRAESMDHTQQIESGLVALERSPGEASLMEEVFRQAHSLKGAARMLGLQDIERLAHEIETLLGEARQGKGGITAETVMAQLAKLDQIRLLVATAVGDADPIKGLTSPSLGVDLAIPEGPTPIVPPSSQSSPPMSEADSPVAMGARDARSVLADLATPVSKSAAGSAVAEQRPAPATSVPLPDFHIDTLRIESLRLDALLQLGGELVVSKGRLARWEVELDQVLTQCDYYQKTPAHAIRGVAEVTSELVRLRGQMSSDIARLDAVSLQLEASIRNLRLLPMSTLLDLFPRMVHDLAAQLGKRVAYRVEGAATVADKRIIEKMKAPLTHLLRNCIDHGIETPAERRRLGKPEEGLIQITVTPGADALNMVVSDDGGGLDLAAIRQQAIKRRLHTAEEMQHLTEDQVRDLILKPGFSTSPMITDVSGRGVGLDVVRACVEHLRGSLELESTSGRGLTIHLGLPVSLTATRVMLLHEWGQTYAVPFDAIAFLRRLRPADLHNLEGRQCFYDGDYAIPLERLGLLLDRPAPAAKEVEWLQCVVLRVSGETFGLAVDEVLETEDIVVKPTTPPLIRVRNLAGLAVLNSGLVCPVLNLLDLLHGMNSITGSQTAAGEAGAAQVQKRVLLVEDSITTRVQERRILEAAGYRVDTAVDGLDAWNKLALQAFDAVVSDIQMPRMTGLELAEKIRQNHRFAELPIVLVTSLAAEEDRRRGLAAGADAYISKSEFDQTLLLDCLARLA